MTLCWLLLASAALAQSEDIFRQIYVGRPENVRQLVEKDPYYVHARDEHRRRTPLMVAVELGKRELVEYFIDQGADIEATDASGTTALRWAAVSGNPALAELLIARGAKPDIFAAVVLGRTNELATFIVDDPRYADPDVRNAPPLIIFASRHDQLETMRMLLAAGANPNPQSSQGQPLIVEAAGRDRLEQVALLLEHGVAVDERTRLSETALRAASEKGSLKLVTLLLERGADPTVADWRGLQALHAAVLGNKIETVRLLLDQPFVDINAVSDEGTPLHIAVWKDCNPSIVRLLLEREADFTVRDRRQKTPLELAQKMKRKQIADLLEEFGAIR